MKLERISAAAQTELPNAKPLSRSHSVSKINAPRPERKRIPEKTARRPPAHRFGGNSAWQERGTVIVDVSMLAF